MNFKNEKSQMGATEVKDSSLVEVGYFVDGDFGKVTVFFSKEDKCLYADSMYICNVENENKALEFIKGDWFERCWDAYKSAYNNYGSVMFNGKNAETLSLTIEEVLKAASD